MFKLEVRTENGFWGRYRSFERARKTMQWLKGMGLEPKIISKGGVR